MEFVGIECRATCNSGTQATSQEYSRHCVQDSKDYEFVDILDAVAVVHSLVFDERILVLCGALLCATWHSVHVHHT